MKNDGLLIQCQNCYTELEPENIHYAYNYVLCIECLMKLGEAVRNENDYGLEWIKNKGDPSEDN